MTTKNQTAAIRAAESEAEAAFGELMYRYLMATERLKLAAHALSLEEKEYLSPATCVVEEATEALVQIRREFGRFEMNHEFIAKEVQS